MRPALIAAAVAALLVLAARPAAAQQREVKIEAKKVRGSVSMLTGQGGNMALSAGDDGAFLVDDQFAPLSEKIQAAIATITEQPVKFLVNTHWHGDHTGGNESFGKAGAVIVAHENVRKRMSTEQLMKAFGRRVPASPPDALPVVTFGETVTFHWNGEEIHVFHVEHAHTDGDSIIHFRKADVFHMGDTFFNGNYPFIDTSSDGSITGIIAAADRVLALAGPETRIIPGHGPLATKKDLAAYRDMLVTVRDRVAKLLAEGKTAEQVIAAKPTADLDEKWGQGFMKPEVWLKLVVEGLRAHPAPAEGASPAPKPAPSERPAGKRSY